LGGNQTAKRRAYTANGGQLLPRTWNTTTVSGLFPAPVPCTIDCSPVVVLALPARFSLLVHLIY
jgi:hypothetical protein